MADDITADRRRDYESLGRLLESAEGSAAAAIARERRILGEVIEKAGTVGEVSLVDELAIRRGAAGEDQRPAGRRRKSR